MKRIIIFSTVLFAMLSFNLEAKRHHNGVGGYFYTELAPYGSWIEIDYGVVVWRPTIIHRNWMPYNVGRWVWTYDGWYWDSYEPFGHITYHYGRWFYDDYYGWLWYPDYEWAPAWVEWRYDNDYIGWAPLHPYAFFSISIGIHFTTDYYTPYHQWHFVSYRHFCDPYVYNYYVAPEYRYRIYSGTKYRNNYVYYDGRIQNRGVDIDYVRIRSGQEIKQRDLVRVRDSRELNRDSDRNRDEIRTLDLKRDELTGNDLNRMEIKRENRRTSLDVDKVQIGKRETRTTDTKQDRNFENSKDTRKIDKTRNESPEVVRRDVEQNRTETKRNSDLNNNKNNNNTELRKREPQDTNNSVETDRKSNDDRVRKENQNKDQNRVNTNEPLDLNKNTREQSTEVKRENTRNNNNQVKQNEEKVSRKENNPYVTKTETRVQTDKTTDKDKSRERSKR